MQKHQNSKLCWATSLVKLWQCGAIPSLLACLKKVIQQWCVQARFMFTPEQMGVWDKTAMLIAPVPAPESKFGTSVAIDEDTIVVG